ncbi:CHY zinc finger protein [Halorussus ruber]|uniref:CHY zinc finger protein n=1 Tax=Halorussus ruber TaxID=1126238 RepID=UPI0010925023|nr:CHY zinc finger protein [Halorussus ruber]
MECEIHGHRVRGVEVDSETRCAHYDTDRDVVALRFACCGGFYPCFRCHEAVADRDGDGTGDHEVERLSVESDAIAALCGVCGAGLTPREFVDGDHECPECGAAFNPGCADHYELYFDFEE